MCVADPVGRLDGDLRLAYAAEALDDSPLAGIRRGRRGDPFEKLVQDGFPTDEVFVLAERDEKGSFRTSWTS